MRSSRSCNWRSFSSTFWAWIPPVMVIISRIIWNICDWFSRCSESREARSFSKRASSSRRCASSRSLASRSASELYLFSAYATAASPPLSAHTFSSESSLAFSHFRRSISSAFFRRFCSISASCLRWFSFVCSSAFCIAMNCWNCVSSSSRSMSCMRLASL